MTVSWLIDAGLPESWGEPPAFLHAAELPALERMRSPKRRAEWLHGRLAAKTLLQACHPGCEGRALAEILIANEPGGAPYATLAPESGRLAGCLSISHSGTLAAAALALEEGHGVGIDVEMVEPRPLGFFEMYFTQAEADFVRGRDLAAQAEAITLVWSAKEAALKALGKGLSLDTRRIEIRPVAAAPNGELPLPAWRRFEIGGEAASDIHWAGWWQPYGDYLLTLAVACPGSDQGLAGNILLQVG